MRSPSRQRFVAVFLVAAALALSVMPTVTATAGTRGSGAAQSNGQDTIVVIGDSLMEGTVVYGSLRSRIAALGTWPRAVVDYRRGRTTVQGTRVLASVLAKTARPTAIVIALGTNDMLSHGEKNYPQQIIDGLMSETMGLPVLWVNISFSTIHPDWRVRAARFNRALLDARADWPGLTVANWSKSFVPKGRSNYISDGIHLSVSGFMTRAIWMTTQIRQFGTAIVNSTTTTTTTTVPTTSTVTTTTTMPPSTTTTSASTTTTTPTTSTTSTAPTTTASTTTTTVPG